MNKQKWIDYAISEYVRSLDHAEDLFPRFTFLLAAAIAVGAALYALADQVLQLGSDVNLAGVIVLACCMCGACLIIGSIYHIAYSINYCGKLEQLQFLEDEDGLRGRMWNHLEKKFPDSSVELLESLLCDLSSSKLLRRIYAAEKCNREVMQLRLERFRWAMNNILGSAALVVLAAVVLVIDRILWRV